MCIRDSACMALLTCRCSKNQLNHCGNSVNISICISSENPQRCLLYTSPSPRDGLLSIRRQRQNVYKRQRLHGIADMPLLEKPVEPLRKQREYIDLHQLRKPSTLSLIHISEPTRRTPLYSSAASECV